MGEGFPEDPFGLEHIPRQNLKHQFQPRMAVEDPNVLVVVQRRLLL